MQKPATVENEVHQAISQLLLDTGTWRDPSSFRFRQVQKQVERLIGVDAIAGSIRMADLMVVTGDMDQVDRWLSNARSLHCSATVAAWCEMTASMNLGYFSRSAAAYPVASALDGGRLSETFSEGLISGALSAMEHNIHMRNRSQLNWGAHNDAAAELARAQRKALDRIGLDESDLRAMLDVAGEVLRERRMMWQGKEPVIRVVDTLDDVGVLYQFFIHGDVGTACEMTDRFIELLIERDLDKPGLSFSFLPDLNEHQTN